MHWMVNVTLLVLAAITAFLVFGLDWNSCFAMVVVSAVGLALAVTFLAALFFVLNQNDRRDLYQQCIEVFKKDWLDLLRVLGLRG